MIGNLSKGQLSHAGNVFTGTLYNHGISLSGNNFQGSTVLFGAGAGLSNEEECKRALFLTNPVDDRGAIVTAKPRLVPQVCQWIYENPSFRDWVEKEDSNQLLWLAGGSGMGKTMMSLYLLHELETDPTFAQDTTILYYFVDNRNEKRNNAVSILRGLIYLAIKAQPGLIRHLLADFEYQREGLFSPNSLEALWRNFQAMIEDEVTGNVICLIDALDECHEESLQPLLRKMCDFFESHQSLERSGKLETSHTTPQKSIKMVLVSREIPRCLSEHLSQFPRVQLGVITKSGPTSKETRSSLRRKWTVRSAKKQHTEGIPKLATVARLALQKKREDQASGISPTIVKPQMRPTLDRPFDDFFFPNDMTASGTSLEEEFKQLENDLNTDHARNKKSQQAYHEPGLPVESSMEHLSQMTEEELEDYIFDEEVDDDLDDDKQEEPMQPLELYIETKVTEIAQDKGYSEWLASAVWEGLNSGGDGTFLWVDLAINELKRNTTTAPKQVLNTLPQDVNIMYCHTLQQVHPAFVDLVVAILRWVVIARRPLSIQELSAALALMGFKTNDPLEIARRGIISCGPLLYVDKDEIVHITHTSVKDLLTEQSSPLTHNPELVPFHINVEELDQKIAAYCLTYLEQGSLNRVSASKLEDEAEFKQHLWRFPLFSYAFLFWPDHLRSSSQSKVNLSSPFFAKRSSIRKTWWLCYYSSVTHKASLMAPRDFTLLHMAAYLNLPAIAHQLEEQGELKPRLNSRDTHGYSPLAVATECGSMDMFLFLIERGASHECVNENVFELACRRGQFEIVEYLLNSGYDANFPARIIPYVNLLSSYTRWFHGMINELMTLDNDQLAFLCGDPRNGWTPLHLVCLFGHVRVAELLVSRGANVHVKTAKKWTALHSAAWGGRRACVKLLLAQGANATDATEDGWNPMHCAARRGKEAVVSFLLEVDAPTDAVTSKQKTALHLAAKNGNAATLKALIAGGANVNAQSYRGETPLHVAARNGNPEAVEALLAGGAFKHIVNKDKATAADSLKMITGSPSERKQEILRILETYGNSDYVPWQPKEDRHDSDTPREKQLAQQLAPPPTRRVVLPKPSTNVSSSASDAHAPVPTQSQQPDPGTSVRPESNSNPQIFWESSKYSNQASLAQHPVAARDAKSTVDMPEQNNKDILDQMFYPPPPMPNESNSLKKKVMHGLRGLLK